MNWGFSLQPPGNSNPVSVARITYTVLVKMLNRAQSINQSPQTVTYW